MAEQLYFFSHPYGIKTPPYSLTIGPKSYFINNFENKGYRETFQRNTTRANNILRKKLLGFSLLGMLHPDERHYSTDDLSSKLSTLMSEKDIPLALLTLKDFEGAVTSNLFRVPFGFASSYDFESDLYMINIPTNKSVPSSF